MHSIRKPTRTFCSTRGLRLHSLTGTRVVLHIMLEVPALCLSLPGGPAVTCQLGLEPQ